MSKPVGRLPYLLSAASILPRLVPQKQPKSRHWGLKIKRKGQAAKSLQCGIWLRSSQMLILILLWILFCLEGGIFFFCAPCFSREKGSKKRGQFLLLTVVVFLLTVKLLRLQSLKALIRRTFPL